MTSVRPVPADLCDDCGGRRVRLACPKEDRCPLELNLRGERCPEPWDSWRYCGYIWCPKCDPSGDPRVSEPGFSTADQSENQAVVMAQEKGRALARSARESA